MSPTSQLMTLEIAGDYATGEDVMLKFRRINDHKMVMKKLVPIAFCHPET